MLCGSVLERESQKKGMTRSACSQNTHPSVEEPEPEEHIDEGIHDHEGQITRLQEDRRGVRGGAKLR